LEINQDEALKIWKTAKFGDDCMTRSVSNLSSTNSKREVSALNLWRRKARQRPIFSLCEDMDKMFGNGIRIGEVTEFCGVPGAGKTQLGMQIACTVQIPTDLHGPGGQAIYIDTEGSFMPRRAYEIAGGVCKHLRGVAAISSDEKITTVADGLTPRNFLENIFVYRVYNYIEQLTCVKSLGGFISKHPKVWRFERGLR